MMQTRPSEPCSMANNDAEAPILIVDKGMKEFIPVSLIFLEINNLLDEPAGESEVQASLSNIADERPWGKPAHLHLQDNKSSNFFDDEEKALDEEELIVLIEVKEREQLETVKVKDVVKDEDRERVLLSDLVINCVM